MSRNKYSSRTATDKADDVNFDQFTYLEFDKDSTWGGGTLGDYSPNESILQHNYSNYTKSKSNVQSALETLNSISQLPIGSVYVSSTSTNPNSTDAYQIDETVMSFTGGSGDVASAETVIAYMYGILFEIPAALGVEDIKPLIEAALNGKDLFNSVTVITDNNATFPTITVTVSHKGINNKIPCYLKDGQGLNRMTFSNMLFETNIIQSAGEDNYLGYGTWTYMGYAGPQALTGGEGTTGNLHYFRRDA